MFHTCKLVHADLSEYNILYHERDLYIIDVSQSVEHDHPNAFNFLRTDLKNVEDFFEKNGVSVIGLRRSFEFVTKTDVELDQTPNEVLERWMNEPEPEDLPTTDPSSSSNRQEGSTEHSARQQDDAVFLQAYIPRTLNEVYDPERDIDLLKSGNAEKLIYEDMIGIVEGAKETPPSKTVHFEGDKPPGSESPSEGSSGEESDEEETGTSEYRSKKPRGHRHEDREAKKVTSLSLSLS
jgi:RIO kinase 1